MRIIRIQFSKTGQAAYISHLDLQRVMARALRKSGMPVWWSQGFNPHIYMSFALPLPLGQQSLCEAVDVKTENEEDDMAAYLAPLNGALPAGIRVQGIGAPKHGAEDIIAALYRITYPNEGALFEAAEAYNALNTAPVLRKTKRSEATFDLKSCVPIIRVEHDGYPFFQVMLPAGGQLTVNPALLTGFLEAAYGLPAAEAGVTRIEVYVGEDARFF